MALRIYKVVQNVILIGVLAVVTGLISMIVILDMNPYVVVSGSMEPTLPVGSVCIVDCQQRSPDEGDIISYKAGDSIVTHRVIEVTDDGYITKGDANDTKDSGTVKEKQIFGTCVASAPKVGYVVMFLRSALGIFTVVMSAICFGFIGRLLESRRE